MLVGMQPARRIICVCLGPKSCKPYGAWSTIVLACKTICRSRLDQKYEHGISIVILLYLQEPIHWKPALVAGMVALTSGLAPMTITAPVMAYEVVRVP